MNFLELFIRVADLISLGMEGNHGIELVLLSHVEVLEGDGGVPGVDLDQGYRLSLEVDALYFYVDDHSDTDHGLVNEETWNLSVHDFCSS